MKKTVPEKSFRRFSGTVTAAATPKTITVLVERKKEDSKYRRSHKVSRKYHVHDEKGVAKVGNKVEFVECRPLSKTKRWRLVSVVNS